LTVTSGARADVGPPPTFVIDSVWLGWPANLIVGLSLAAAVVGVFRGLRRWGTPRWLAVVLCLLGYAAANFGIYMYALARASEQRETQQRERYRSPKPQVKPEPSTGRSQ
jgi:hypothetical protein